MLATMRPTQVLHTTLQQSQPSSTPVSRTSSSHSSSANGRHQAMSANKTSSSNPTAAARGKKTEATVVAQTTPGLLTLSRPLDSTADVSGDEARSKSSQRRGKKKKKLGSVLSIDDIKAEESDTLSRSAPNASTEWDMPQNKKQDAVATVNSGLTWQQELLNNQPKANPAAAKEKKKTAATAGKKDKSKAATSKQAPQSTGKNDSLTWQQELLGSNQYRGQTFDVFADARDAQTFGSGPGAPPPKAGKKERGAHRQRADSAGEMGLRAKAGNHAAGGKKNGVAGDAGGVHLGSSSAASSSSAGPPSTPNKLAYAGPNFHNSPSPASLPMPKFLQSKPMALGSSGSGSATPNHRSLFAREAQHSNNHPDPNASMSSASDSSSEDDPDTSFTHSVKAQQNNRFVRGGTAPPALSGALPGAPSAGSDRNLTIESLLAKMMQPGSD